MFKKIFTYGLAFGSIAGAFLFVHLNNYGPDMSGFQKGFYVLLQSLVIPFTCVFMLVRSMRKEAIETSNTDFKAGTVIIAGLFSTLVLSLTVSSIYAFIAGQFPEIIEQAIRADLSKIDQDADRYIEFYKKPIEEIRQFTSDRYSTGNQFRENMFQFSSMGLFISGIMALVYMNKDKKRKAQNPN